jgi:outer membrane protein TolC
MILLLILLIVHVQLCTITVTAASQERSLTLERCIEVAMEHNPSFSIALLEEEQAASGKKEAFSYFLPHLDLTFSHLRSVSGKGDVEYEGISFVRSSERYWYSQGGVSLTQQLYAGGQNYFRYRESQLRYSAARAAVRHSLAMLLFEVERKYWDAHLSQKVVEVRLEAVDLSREELNRAEELRALGKNVDADVLKTKVELADTKSELAGARKNASIALRGLFDVMGVPFDSAVVLQDSDTLYTAEGTPVSGFHDESALDRREDVRRIQLLIEGVKCTLQQVKGTRYPALYGFFDFSWGSKKLEDIERFYDENYNWQAGIGLSIPVFDGFFTKSLIEKTRFELQILKEEKRLLLQEIQNEIHSALISLREATERIELCNDRIRFAGEHLRIVKERYRLGKESMLEVISAKVAFTEAQLAKLNAERDARIAEADLRRASGIISIEDVSRRTR